MYPPPRFLARRRRRNKSADSFCRRFGLSVKGLPSAGRYTYPSHEAHPGSPTTIMKLYQLRYPNSHTHYFSCCLLYLFAEANTEAIQEQITRVLLERLIVNRPHPWGLLITFIELIKNPTFKFWAHEFVHCAPEIQKLFDQLWGDQGGGGSHGGGGGLGGGDF